MGEELSTDLREEEDENEEDNEIFWDSLECLIVCLDVNLHVTE